VFQAFLPVPDLLRRMYYYQQDIKNIFSKTCQWQIFYLQIMQVMD